MISGVNVVLHKKSVSGTNAIGEKIYTEQTETISNILVEPASNDAIVDELTMTGKKLAFILHIPRTDENSWEDCIVDLPSPWNISVKTFATDKMIFDPRLTPLPWGRKVKCELIK